MAGSVRWGGLRPEPYDPDARDADGDGIIQEGTAWERPAGARLLSDLGEEIVRGATASQRPAGMRVVGRDGRTIDYTPTYGLAGAPSTSPSPRHLGVPSLKDRGLPSVGEIVHGPDKPTQTPTPNPTPEPQRKTPQPITAPLFTTLDEDVFERRQVDRAIEAVIADNYPRWRSLRIRNGDEEIFIDYPREVIETPVRAKMIVAHDIGVTFEERIPTEQLQALALGVEQKKFLPWEVRATRDTDEVLILQVPLSEDSGDLVTAALPIQARSVSKAEAQEIARGRSRDQLRQTLMVDVAPDDPDYNTLLAEYVAQTLITQWSVSSNDDHPLSLAIQEVAARRFALGDDVYTWNTDRAIETIIESHGPILEAFIDAQYEHTQRFLQERNITSVVLYRGMAERRIVPDFAPPEGVDPEDEQFLPELFGVLPADAGDSGTIPNITLPLRPLSSFSTKESGAQMFSDKSGGRYAVILIGEVPAERIFSFPVTGAGCLGESEVVVLGGDAAFHATWIRPSRTHIEEGMAFFDEITKHAPDWFTEQYALDIDTTEINGKKHAFLTLNSGTGPSVVLGVFNLEGRMVPILEPGDETGNGLTPKALEGFTGMPVNVPLYQVIQDAKRLRSQYIDWSTPETWEPLFSRLDPNPAASRQTAERRLEQILPVGVTTRSRSKGTSDKWFEFQFVDGNGQPIGWSAQHIDGSSVITDISDFSQVDESAVKRVVARAGLEAILDGRASDPVPGESSVRTLLERLNDSDDYWMLDFRGDPDGLAFGYSGARFAVPYQLRFTGLTREDGPKAPDMTPGLTVELGARTDSGWTPERTLLTVPEDDLYTNPQAIQAAIDQLIAELRGILEQKNKTQ